MKPYDYFNKHIITYEQVRNAGHRHQGGIYKPKNTEYVYSIITNAGENNKNYEDSLSDDLILTYHGRGRERDQTLDDYDNKALSLNFQDNVPVRVFAGSDNKYRDWGYWSVIDLDTETGTDEFKKLIFKLIPSSVIETNSNDKKEVNNETTRFAQKKITYAERQIRYAPELRQLKKSYDYVCQVDESHILEGRNGKKVHVHHLEPIGPGGVLVSPNHSNEIVVCPSCHSLFDDGSIYIDPEDGETIIHWNKDNKYHNKKIRVNDGHIFDKSLLKRVYQYHWENK